MPLITTTTGGETRTLGTSPLRTAALKAVAFGVQENGLEAPMFVMHKPVERVLGSTRMGEHGTWIMAEYTVGSGALVKFFVSFQETGYVKRAMGVYVQVGLEYPHTTIRFPGIATGGGSNTFPSLMGTYRMLPLADLASLKIRVSPHLERFYAAPERDFEIIIDTTTVPRMLGARALDLT